MDSSTDCFEEIEESMLDLVQRAEAFLSAHPSTSGSSSSTSGMSFSSSASSSVHNNHTGAIDDSSATTGDSSFSSVFSHESSLANSSVSGNASILSTISGSSSRSGSSAHHSSINTSEPFSDDSSSSVSSVQRSLSEDCILVSEAPVPVIDLCALPVQRANRIRPIANSAPIVDLITLDDSIIEVTTPVSSVFRPREPPKPAVLVNEYRGAPPTKRSQEGAVLNLSQSSDGVGQEPAIALTCPICFDSIFSKQASSTICGHLFCHACISQEIQLRKQCPLCKRKLARNQIHPIYCN